MADLKRTGAANTARTFLAIATNRAPRLKRFGKVCKTNRPSIASRRSKRVAVSLLDCDGLSILLRIVAPVVSPLNNALMVAIAAVSTNRNSYAG